MNIILKNRFLYFLNYKLKCTVGKNGIFYKKKEGDNKTPRGKFKFEYILYRKDRIINLRSRLKTLEIKKDMGWCDDSNSKNYNQLIKIPFKYTYEKLWLKENIYDIILVLNYNINPVIKNKGSAIFLHIAKNKYQSTKGCVAISKSNIKLLASKLNRKTKLNIL